MAVRVDGSPVNPDRHGKLRVARHERAALSGLERAAVERERPVLRAAAMGDGLRPEHAAVERDGSRVARITAARDERAAVGRIDLAAVYRQDPRRAVADADVRAGIEDAALHAELVVRGRRA